MLRAFGLCLVLLAPRSEGQVSADGTLVVTVPAKNGIIVAADTRTTVPIAPYQSSLGLLGVTQKYCDGQAKIFVAKRRKRTVVFQTGSGLQLPLFGVLPLDVCEYLRSTPPILDIADVLMQQIDAKPTQVLTRAEVQEIAEHCVSRVAEFARKYEAVHPLNGYLDQGMFRAAIVSYDVKRETGLLGSFVIRVDSTGAPVLGEVLWRRILKTDRTFDDLSRFGETEYVDQYAIKLGQTFLGPYNALSSRTVAQTSLSEAVSAALSLITATEETAKSIPPPSGIGGPIDVATITNAGTVLVRH